MEHSLVRQDPKIDIDLLAIGIQYDYDNSKRIVNVRYYLYGSNGKIEKMYSKGSRGSREETYFYENDRLQKIVIRQFDRNDIEQDTLQHSFDYKSNGELKSIILSTELYSETIYQET